MKKSNLAIFLLIFVAVITAAQVYRWVDEQGRVHFGDRPPEKANPDVLTIPEGPSTEEIKAAKEELHRTIELQKERDKVSAEKKQKRREEKISRHAETEERFRRCVAARQQVAVLGYKVRVFRLRPDWSREYLDNEIRQREISRLTRLVDEYCDTDPESLRQQLASIRELGRRLKITCVAPREKIATMSKPATESDEEKIRKYQAYINKNCPQVDFKDMWIADRVFVK